MRTNTCVSYLAKSSLALASASADGAADAVAFRGFASAALVDGVQIAHPLRLARSANVVVRSHRTAATYKRKWHSRRFRERGSRPLNRYSPRWFSLRLDVQSSSQVLQRDGCLCHRT